MTAAKVQFKLLNHTIEQTSQMTQIPLTTLRLMCRNGEVPGAKKIGRRWLIPVKTVHRLVPDPDE